MVFPISMLRDAARHNHPVDSILPHATSPPRRVRLGADSAPPGDILVVWRSRELTRPVGGGIVNRSHLRSFPNWERGSTNMLRLTPLVIHQTVRIRNAN